MKTKLNSHKQVYKTHLLENLFLGSPPNYKPINNQYLNRITNLHSKITMTGDEVPYYTVTALVPTLQ